MEWICTKSIQACFFKKKPEDEKAYTKAKKNLWQKPRVQFNFVELTDIPKLENGSCTPAVLCAWYHDSVHHAFSEPHDIFYPELYLTSCCLKGPKCERFGFEFFALIRPIWIGDLGTRPKNYKFWWFRLKIAILYFLALSPSTLKNCKRCRLLR